MPLPRVSLRSFLSSAKTALRTQQTSPVTFIIGNESAGQCRLSLLPHSHTNILADLDSLCSAVVLAYLRTYAPSSKSNTFYIPLSNIPQTDLSIRPELLPILSRANLKQSDLITLSDLPQRSQLPAENTQWILVDHNALQGELGSQYGKRVQGCIDHHIEENKVPKETGDEPRIVKKTGSCTSLVVEFCKEAWNALSEESKSKDDEVACWDKELAYLALGPVLIDTSNMRNEAETTERDIAIVHYLESKITAVPGEQYNPEVYFREIAEAKEDISSIDLHGLLRKDYKQWTEGSLNLGVSSVMADVKTLIDKAGDQQKFLNTLKQFAEERKLSILSIMTKSKLDGIFRRELLVWGMNEKGSEAAKRFEAESKEKLGLFTWEEESLDTQGDKEWRRCWWQRKLENSRKQVAPLLRAAMV